MSQTLNNFIRTNPILKIKDQNFSNEVIFEEVLQDGDFINLNLLNCDFQHTDLYYCDFWDCNFQNCNFSKGFSLWRKCNFYNCTFENCTLSDCEWNRVDFYSTRFRNCNFHNLHLKWSSLFDCELIETNWNKIFFEKVGFHRIEIQKTTFANLDFSQIYPMSICQANLEKCTQVKNYETFYKAIKID